jgi:uncharacterized protein YbaR (Trm112 family)
LNYVQKAAFVAAGFSLREHRLESLCHPLTANWHELDDPPNCGGNMPISKELLEILACPQCKGDIRLNEKGDGLICEKCRLLYEIKDDIPIMLIDEAKPLK